MQETHITEELPQPWILDEEPAPPEQWWLLTVGLALLITLIIWPILVTSIFLMSGLPEWMFGEEYVEALKTPNTPQGRQASIRITLWATVAGFPYQAVLLPILFWTIHRTRPQEMNLTLHRVKQDVPLGLGFWVVLSAVTLGLHVLATTGYNWLIPSGAEAHALEQLVNGGQLWPLEKWLIVIAAMVVAPVIEELVFRGVLLRWARQQPYASDVIVAVALVLSLPTSESAWQTMREMNDIKGAIHAAAPLVWGLVLTLIYGVVSWHSSSGPAARIVATAFLFAAVHGAWPSPVPLFVLALGLAWLAEKTDSLVGPMIIHCLFNGIACGQMFGLWQWLVDLGK